MGLVPCVCVPQKGHLIQVGFVWMLLLHINCSYGIMTDAYTYCRFNTVFVVKFVYLGIIKGEMTFKIAKIFTWNRHIDPSTNISLGSRNSNYGTLFFCSWLRFLKLYKFDNVAKKCLHVEEQNQLTPVEIEPRTSCDLSWCQTNCAKWTCFG